MPTKKTKAPKKAPKKKKATKTVKAKTTSDISILPVSRHCGKPDVDEVVHRINLAYGKTGPAIQHAYNSWNVFDLRRPSGILSLDLNTGGGLPACGLSQLDGPEGVGKNFLMYHYMAECQRLYGDQACIAMASIETPMDKRFAQRCGVHIAMSPYDIGVENRARKRRGEPPMDSEEVRIARTTPTMGKFLILDQGGSEKILNSIVDLVGYNICQIIGIDSWDAVQTYMEREKDLGEHPQRAATAQLLTFFTKKISDEGLPDVYCCPDCGSAPLKQNVISIAELKYKWGCTQCKWVGLDPAVEKNETTLVAIRQARGNMDAGKNTRAPKWGSTGARAVRHQNLVRVTISPGKRLPEKGPQVGKEVNWRVSKAKCGSHEGPKGTFNLYFDTMSVDVYEDMIAQCTTHKVVSSGGGVYNAPCLDVKVKGRDKFMQLLEEHPDYWDVLRDELYLRANLAHVRLR